MLMAQKSMVDIAYEYARQANEPVSFKELWERVVEELGFNEEEALAKISIFYTNLSLDCRFHSEENNTWILRSKLLFDDATKDIFLVNDDSSDEEEDEEYEEDEDEEDEDLLDNREEDEEETLNSNMYNNDEEEDE